MNANSWYSHPLPHLNSPLWLVATLALYCGFRLLHQKRQVWWTSPVLLTPAVLILLIVGLHATYQEYIADTEWLVTMLGPTTVAFAIPIWQQREIVRKRFAALVAGTLTATVLSLGSTWVLGRILGLNAELLTSILPHSVTTPFALAVSSKIGGATDLTAVCVVVTGLLGMVIGDLLLQHLPVRSRTARGAFLAFGAHGAGTARAQQIGNEEAMIASLSMIAAGLFNVLVAAPLLAAFAH